MDERLPDRGRLMRARRSAEDAQMRADRAAEIAGRHEASLATSPPGRRELHERMARAHRETETRHRTAAAMASWHAERIERWLALAPAQRGEPPRFMAAVTASAGAAGAAITLGGDRPYETSVASGPMARAAQELEAVLGEGPGIECRAAGPTYLPGSGLAERWPVYGPAVAQLGVHAVAAVPLHVADTTVGSLVVYGDQRRGIDGGIERVRHVGGAVVAILLLSTVEGRLGTQLLDDELDLRPRVHQAVGLVSAQRGCSTGDALALLRARAFRLDQELVAVADEVIDGTLAWDD